MPAHVIQRDKPTIAHHERSRAFLPCEQHRLSYGARKLLQRPGFGHRDHEIAAVFCLVLHFCFHGWRVYTIRGKFARWG